MGYGGPRTAFYIQQDWDVLTETIQKEDNARVRAVLDREDREAERVARIQREEEQHRKQQEEARKRQEEDKAIWKELQRRQRAAAGIAECKMSPEERAKRKRQKERTAELALPKVYAPPEIHNGLTYGMTMYPRPWHVDFPVGRCGKPYTPGVDRDRLVPPPNDLTRLPPWVGNYSSHYGSHSQPWQRSAEEEKEKYYCSKIPPYRTAEEKSRRHALLEDAIRAIEEKNEEDESSKRAASSANGCRCYHHDAEKPGGTSHQTRSTSNETHKSACSIFSHAESNGPIAATGAQHMEYSSSRAEVDDHLRKYGGALTGPSPGYHPKKYATEMNLPELQDRIIRLQLMKPQKVG